MQRYSPQVKLFAIDQRKTHKPWKQIQIGIRNKFNVDPPSVRAMEKWLKTIDRERLNQMILEESRKGLPSIEAEAIQNIATGLIPILWQAKYASSDIEQETWCWFFSIVERELGEEKFNRFLNEYKNRKNKTTQEN